MNSEVDWNRGCGLLLALLEAIRDLDGVDGVVVVTSNNWGSRGGDSGDVIDDVSPVERDVMIDGGGGGGVDGDDGGKDEDNDGYNIASSSSS